MSEVIEGKKEREWVSHENTRGGLTTPDVMRPVRLIGWLDLD